MIIKSDKQVLTVLSFLKIILVISVTISVSLTGCGLEDPAGGSKAWLYASIRVFVYTVVGGGQIPLENAEVTLEYYSDEEDAWKLAGMKRTGYPGEVIFSDPNVFKVYEDGDNDHSYRVLVNMGGYQGAEAGGLRPSISEPDLYIAIGLVEE